ncbi:DUF475 domain-containing protein [Leucothrix arctica]|uniref:DUF475 domain-containing protein n=1 Tax=Leucothrix arctica TaxID=1481894 RepID=A0A317CJ20_9GAMM|nr:DUF475 domain-containing protein [Leucothrix arctica]PWQ98558.1 hypothetical protein DKT75_03650 [Leucothrix arctica]
MDTLFKYYKGSFLLFFLGIVAAFFLGGMQAVFIILILCILEISLSFDNAVVNATVLKDMSEVWRRRFLTWGILIAVFGMRIVFPVVIVSIVSGLSPWAALEVAVNDPDAYAAYMTSAHISIMAFGGAFLMMVGLSFFFDDDKDHWIPVIENPLSRISNIPFVAYILALLIVAVMGFLVLSGEDSQSFLTAGVSGVLVFFVIEKITEYMEHIEKKRAVEQAAKSGAAMFLYLEVLDASFSFDGVIGAFAITTDIFIIAIGLGVGAMFVRSMTIMLVEKGTLEEYVYLEHGAFYAIVALASIMFIKTVGHVPEVLTGLIGAGFICVAFIHSIMLKRKEQTN